MTAAPLRVGWYRFRVTFRRRRGAYLSLVILVGLVGGLSMGSVAGARRTQSSFPAFLARTNASDLIVSPRLDAPTPDPQFLSKIAHLPRVVAARASINPSTLLLGPGGVPRAEADGATGLFVVGSYDGLYLTQDRLSVAQGRMLDPTRPDEFVTTSAGARLSGLHLGDQVDLGLYTPAQSLLPDYGTARVPPHRRVRMRLVGIVVFNSAVVQDDIDRLPTFVVLSPALTRGSVPCCFMVGLQLRGGARDVAAVEADLARAVPDAAIVQVTGIRTASAERGTAPLSIALGVFGGIAGLAAVVIGAQVMGRQIRADGEERATLRALGANRITTWLDPLLGLGGAIVVGSGLAVVVAIALSPLTPLGPVRRVDRSRTMAFDWTVLGWGSVALVASLAVTGAVMAWLGAP
ncbi:MAG: transporter permease, partial [Acidimicrobiales bacterium]|nr:transporter permease [Acidimicrobiales bacterium]